LAGNRIVCEKNNVDYITVRKAMCQDARTKEELKEAAGVCLECSSCESELDQIMTSVCGCKGTSLEAVVNAVKEGADTVDKVALITGAGTDCGRCKALVENIIKLGR
jgi:bacterioferritin-associated ferredoxin